MKTVMKALKTKPIQYLAKKTTLQITPKNISQKIQQQVYNDAKDFDVKSFLVNLIISKIGPDAAKMQYHVLYDPNVNLSDEEIITISNLAIETIKVISSFIANDLPYISGPPQEDIQPSPTTLVNGGACLDKAVLLAAFLLNLGIKTDIVMLHNHAVVRVFIPKYGYFYIETAPNESPIDLKIKKSEIKSIVKLV